MRKIIEKFELFKNMNQSLLKDFDGLNGDCSIFANMLYDFYKENNFEPKIFTLNKGVHFWIEVNNTSIDCRGVFKNRESLTRYFNKFIVKERIYEISKTKLLTYIKKRA